MQFVIVPLISMFFFVSSACGEIVAEGAMEHQHSFRNILRNMANQDIIHLQQYTLLAYVHLIH